MNPIYSVYIISKGRAESRLTVKTLSNIGVPFKIVIEPQEYDEYSKYINSENILVLPFKNLGMGSIPARNWVWNYSIKNKEKKHWLMDDNIDMFFRFNNNLKVPVSSGTIFKCMEDFTDRYNNIAFSGPNYFMFASRKTKMPPYYFNTRIYSCTLINNSIPFRWRGRYNEDTDICLRALKAGYGTFLFNAFLQGKKTTMTMPGGNTDNVYIDGDNRRKFAESLYNQHPDVVKITKKWGRWHHHVDYRGFQKQHPIIKDNIIIDKRINNYGMKLIALNE